MSEKTCGWLEHQWKNAGFNPNTNWARVRCFECGHVAEVSPAALLWRMQTLAKMSNETSGLCLQGDVW